MTEPVDVSVVMPAYRAAATIERAIRSVVAQDPPPRQLVVVDDGSDDGTAQVVEALRAEMGAVELTLVCQANAGAGAARNRALREATCGWVAFLDADDQWLPGKLARSLAEAEKGNHVLVAHDGFEDALDGTSAPLEGSARFRASAADPFAGLYRKGFIDTCSVVVRRQAVLEVGGFDPSLPVGQDFDLFLAVLSRPGASFTVFPDRLVRYIRQEGSITTRTWRRLRCQMRILVRHRPALRGWRRPYSVLFRTLAVHKEAVDVYARQGRWLMVAASLGHLPWGVMVGLLAPAARRPRNL